MMKISLSTLFMLITILSFSQTESKKNQLIEAERLQKDIAWNTAMKNIKELENGSILVALDYQQRKISYYKKHNNVKAANKLKAKQQKINKYIILSIDSLYSYSKVQYFDYDDLIKIKGNKINEVIFYNSKGEKDQSIDYVEGFFLVGYFGHVEEPETGTSEVKYATKNSLSAFVLMDNQLKQLKSPFPYYSKYFEKGNVKKRYNLPIRHLQENLEIFANKGQVKYSKREKRRTAKRKKREQKDQAKNQ